MKSRVLYISYDGILSPLGQSQVLAYQERLADIAELHILSFEKVEDSNDAEVTGSVVGRLKRSGIFWHPRRYHKSPSALATSFDIVVGILSGLWYVLRHKVQVVHARSYVPAVMALALRRLTGIKFIFDMRGFWADERVDGGLWPADSRLYRVAKWFEKRFLLNADHVISLTDEAVREIKQFEYLRDRMPPITVIPTCADLEKFRPAARDEDNFVLGYVGSASTWYQFDAVVQCFAALLAARPDARIVILNRGEHDYIRQQLSKGGVPVDSVELRAADYDEVPRIMGRMDAGVFFYKPSFSRAACSPTKLGEFLGCGIPCLSNTGVGDMASILEDSDVGVAISSFEATEIRNGLMRLLELTETDGISDRCVAVAKREFSLGEGVRRYAEVYAALATDQ